MLSPVSGSTLRRFRKSWVSWHRSVGVRSGDLPKEVEGAFAVSDVWGMADGFGDEVFGVADRFGGCVVEDEVTE